MFFCSTIQFVVVWTITTTYCKCETITTTVTTILQQSSYERHQQQQLLLQTHRKQKEQEQQRIVAATTENGNNGSKLLMTTKDDDNKNMNNLPILDNYLSMQQQQQQQQEQLQQHQPTNENDNDNDDELSVFIHIGPMKTGSTAIQESMTQIFTMDVNYTVDNFEDAGLSMNDNMYNTANFVSCFRPPNQQMKWMVCKNETLQLVPKIAQERNHNLIISAEYLTNPDVNIQILQEFLQPYWKKQYIIMFYRRYYEWLISFHNEGNKKRLIPDRITIVQFLDRETDLEVWYNKMYLIKAMERWKQYIPNIRIENMYDKQYSDSDVREQFFCNALPDTSNACTRIRQIKENEKTTTPDSTTTSKNDNGSVQLVYEEIAYYGLQSISAQLLSQQRNLTISDVVQQIRYYQEHVLNRTQYDFGTTGSNDEDMNNKIKTCPNNDTIQYLLDRTIETERTLFPQYYEQYGQYEIQKHFIKDSKTKFCHYNGQLILQYDTIGQWKQFFNRLVE
jgi:hypothetical protein